LITASITLLSENCIPLVTIYIIAIRSVLRSNSWLVSNK